MNSAVKACQIGDVAVRRDAEAEFARLLAEDPDDRECADRRAEHLREEVAGHVPPGELAGHREGEGHRGVDVVARDVPERVDRRDDDRAERQRDEAEFGGREGRVASHESERRHGADADEDEEGGAEELGSEPLPGPVVIHDVRSPLNRGARRALGDRARFDIVECASVIPNDAPPSFTCQEPDRMETAQ